MIIEERDYGLRPGAVHDYLHLWHQCGREPQIRHLGDPLGVYQVETGSLNTLVYLWRFISWDDRARRRAALMSDPQFAAFRSQVRGLLLSQQNRILAPAPILED